MGKRKRNAPTIEEVLERPWCYYCERDFDDLKVLIAHQKAKHYKCDQCNRRLNTAGGLSVHMSQVHKETLTQIENALPGRGDINVEIFGMHGIPSDVLEAHKNRITSEYFKAVAERRAETGNPPPGTNTTDAAAKKPKIETPEEIRKRLAEHKAKREAEKEAKAQAERNSSNSTPLNGASPFDTPAREVSKPAQEHFNSQYHGSPVQANSAQGPSLHMHSYGAPPPLLSPGAMPFAIPPQGMPPFVSQQPKHGHPTMPSQGFAGSPAMPPQSFSGPPGYVASPQQYAPPRPAFSPKQANGGSQGPAVAKQPELPKTPTALLVVPGLPSRPVVDAPSFSREDMARLHAGAQARQNSMSSFSPSAHAPSPLPSANDQPSISTPSSSAAQQRPSDHIDDLIDSITNGHAEPSATQQDDASTAASPTGKTVLEPQTTFGAQVTAAAAAVQPEPRSKSTGKKSKHANIKTKLVYSDNETSPEEKRASTSRYAFTRRDSTEYVLGDAGPAVTGAVRGSDDVMDSQAEH